MVSITSPPCSQCHGMLYCKSCRGLCGYLRVLPPSGCSDCVVCAGSMCSCRPALRHPCITDWFWVGGGQEVHHTQVHGAVHFPPGVPVPFRLENHRTISTSTIRQVLSVQYGLVRTRSGSIYQLHQQSRNSECRALAQRPIVVPLDLLYLHRLLQLERAQLRDDALLTAWWRLPSALFAVVLQSMLPYIAQT